MRKEFIFLVIFIILIPFFCILVLKKQVNDNDNSSNPYQEFSFYKESNLERYKKYYLNNNKIKY